MNTKHTSGEWTATESNSDNTAIGIKSEKSLVATVWISKFYNDVPNKKEAEANAKLIASAPELLKELTNMVECWDNDIFQYLDIKQAKEAIKKATNQDR